MTETPNGSAVSIVIATYGRDRVLLETLSSLLGLRTAASEILVVDQTAQHDAATTSALALWAEKGQIRWIRLDLPSITRAMNVGLREAGGDIVLFLDDDVIPSPDLVSRHASVYSRDEITVVVGQVLQPGELERPEAPNDCAVGLRADLGFKFNSAKGAYVRSAIACNMSVRRRAALQIGGFDENFVGSAYRFETEFARRVWRTGGLVWFEPSAGVRHLRAARGGTRASGGHMASASPLHGVGDYYFALTQGISLETIRYMLMRPIREVRTRFHLRQPWWIPVKFVGELRALVLAVRLWRRGPKYI